MRTIVNISLPVKLTEIVNKEVVSGGYASKSEFFRALLRSWIEGRLVIELEKSRDELKAGKGKLLPVKIGTRSYRRYKKEETK